MSDILGATGVAYTVPGIRRIDRLASNLAVVLGDVYALRAAVLRASEIAVYSLLID